MKIKTKLKLIIIFIIALLVGIVSMNLWQNGENKRTNRQRALVEKLSFEVFQSNQIRDEYFVYRSERSKQQWFILSKKIIEQFREMSANFTDHDERISIEKITNLHENVYNLFNQLLRYDEEVSNHNAAGTEMRERIISQMMGISHLLYLESSKLSKAINKKADKQILYSNILTAVTFGLLGLVIIYFSRMLIQRVTYPLAKLKEGTRVIAGGNFGHRVNITSSDEIGELANDFDMMTEQLQSVTVSRDELGKEIEIRKQAEESLRESEERFRKLFEHMSSGVAIYKAVGDGEDFLFQDFNKAGEAIEHVTREDIVGKRVTEIFPGVKEFGAFEVFQRVWKTGESEYFPASVYKDEHDTGTWRESWVYKLPSGEVVAVYNDITERKRAANALDEEHRRLQKALDEVRTLRGIVPICANCKKIRDDKGYWNQVEKYVSERTEAEFSHGFCPDCAKKLYPDIYRGKQINDIKKLVILLVDDEEDFRMIFIRQIRRILKDHELEFIEASDGEEALELLKGGAKPSIIILDYTMPKINGVELLKRIDSDHNDLYDVPRIMISGYTQKEMISEAQRLRCVLFEKNTDIIFYQQICQYMTNTPVHLAH